LEWLHCAMPLATIAHKIASPAGRLVRLVWMARKSAAAEVGRLEIQSMSAFRRLVRGRRELRVIK